VSWKLSVPGALSRHDERPNSMAALLVDATACGGCCVPVSPASTSISCTQLKDHDESNRDKNKRLLPYLS
jgi:hypothetical protein